jgi:hypothetical protein
MVEETSLCRSGEGRSTVARSQFAKKVLQFIKCCKCGGAAVSILDGYAYCSEHLLEAVKKGEKKSEQG